MSQPVLDATGLARFKKLELLAHSVVEGFMTGLHKSPFKGYAIEFAEHRQYAPGDDLKHLDWKILGKLDRYYVKQYEEDTSLRACLALDCSGSMGYRGSRFSKLDYGRFICGVLSYLLVRQKDAVGLLTFTDGVSDFLPAHASKKQLNRILDKLEGCKASGENQIGEVLQTLASKLTRRALVVIVSDFFDDIDEISLALTHFARRRHEVICFQVLDRRELDFPFTGITRFESLEDDAALLVDPIRLRREYRERFEAHNHQLREICHRLHIDFVQMMTDVPFEHALAGYLSGRLKR
jgi:uncharacterized protein (DUF58 family)